MRYILIFALTFILALAAQEVVAKPVQTGTIVLNEVDPDVGEVITFTWNGDFKKQQPPRIEVDCGEYSGDAEAYQQFLLGSGTNWAGGECVASLYYWQWQPVQQQVVLATTTFTVE
jgi:hypothetical protein